MTTQSPSRQRTPKQAYLRMEEDGTISALSSNMHDVYWLTIAPVASCTCPAGKRYGRCYHLTALATRYAAFWPKPTRPAPPPVSAPHPAPQRPPRRCQAALYPDCACERCAAKVAA